MVHSLVVLTDYTYHILLSIFQVTYVSDLFAAYQMRRILRSLRWEMQEIAHHYTRMDSNTTTGTGFASESVDLEDIVFTSM